MHRKHLRVVARRVVEGGEEHEDELEEGGVGEPGQQAGDQRPLPGQGGGALLAVLAGGGRE